MVVLGKEQNISDEKQSILKLATGNQSALNDGNIPVKNNKSDLTDFPCWLGPTGSGAQPVNMT